MRNVIKLNMPHDGVWVLVIKDGQLVRTHWEKWYCDDIHRHLNAGTDALVSDVLHNPSSYSVALLVKLGLIDRNHPVAMGELLDYPLSDFGV